MPLYEYVCADCQKHFEKYVRAFGEGVECPACASKTVEKQLSTFAFAGVEGDMGSDGGGCCGGGCGCGH